MYNVRKIKKQWVDKAPKKRQTTVLGKEIIIALNVCQYDVPLPGQLSKIRPVSARGSPMRERKTLRRLVVELIPPFEKICRIIWGLAELEEERSRLVSRVASSLSRRPFADSSE